MKSIRPSLLPLLGALAGLFPSTHADAAPFSPGTIAVVRVGAGAVALNSAATAVFIDEYTPAGTQVQSIALPVGGSTPLTLSGTATSEGSLTRSPNGGLLCFAGYQAPAGTAGISATTSATWARGIGTMDVSGSFVVASSTATQHSGASIRSGATDGANNFWSGGTSAPAGTGGVNYFGTASAAAQLLSGNLRWVNIFNGELYFSSGSATPGTGIHQFTGSPTAAAVSTPLTVVAGQSQSPYGFSVSPTGTAMYVADDRSLASGGGIQRWNKAGAVWTLAYTLGTGAGSTGGARGLVVDWSGAAPVLYATTTETSNRLITLTDLGEGSVATLVASAGANKAFRGVAFAPTRLPRPQFFVSNLMPPPSGVYVSEPGIRVTYANGTIIRDISQKGFTQSQPPPPPGGTQVYSFVADMELDVSADGGATFQRVMAPANVTMRLSHSFDTTTTSHYDGEMLQMAVSGGGLPAGVMARESPTLASTGRTTIKPVGGGFMIDSFFNLFTEITLDGGQTWVPSTTGPLHICLNSTDPDTDDDGLPDLWELANFGNLASGSTDDHDQDGSTNGYEYLAGTSPINPASVLRPASQVSGLDLSISFPTLDGHQYAIESSTDLSVTSWTAVVTGIGGDGSIRTILIINGFNSLRRYYRVIPSLSP